MPFPSKLSRKIHREDVSGRIEITPPPGVGKDFGVGFGFRDLVAGDVFKTLEVSNGPSDFEDASVGSGGAMGGAARKSYFCPAVIAVFLLKTNEPAAPNRDTAADRIKA